MGKRRTRKLVGVTTFEDPEDGVIVTNREEVEVDGRRAIIRIGPPDVTPAVIESTDRKVVHHTERIMRARKAHEHRYAPCTPDFKPRRRKPKLPPMMTCPVCNGNREAETEDGYGTCPNCQGDGEVRRP